jgi:hypothetical protein
MYLQHKINIMYNFLKNTSIEFNEYSNLCEIQYKNYINNKQYNFFFFNILFLLFFITIFFTPKQVFKNISDIGTRSVFKSVFNIFKNITLFLKNPGGSSRVAFLKILIFICFTIFYVCFIIFITEYTSETAPVCYN